MTHAPRVLRIGTRGSELALWQARRVRDLLAARGIGADLITIRTSGDEGTATQLPPLVTGKGLFTKELEEALLAQRVDIAVHSLKDLEVRRPAGLVVAAFPEREDPRDALVSAAGRGPAELPGGARVGTSSLRRRAALLAFRNDLDVVSLRGNVPTRVRKVGVDGMAAAVLALAGLRRLDLAGRAVPLDPLVFPPAPGQGVLAVEARADDTEVLDLVRPLDDPSVRRAAEAERTALETLGGGCDAAIGAVCLTEGATMVLHVKVFAPDGGRVLAARVPVEPRAPQQSGREAAARLSRAGAEALILLGTERLAPRGRGGRAE